MTIPAKGKQLIPQFYEILAKDIMDKRIGDMPLIEQDASIGCVLSILTGSDHVWVVESKGSKKLVGINNNRTRYFRYFFSNKKSFILWIAK